jgi:hypothetical protein
MIREDRSGSFYSADTGNPQVDEYEIRRQSPNAFDGLAAIPGGPDDLVTQTRELVPQARRHTWFVLSEQDTDMPLRRVHL